MRRFTTFCMVMLLLGFLFACSSKKSDEAISEDIVKKVLADMKAQEAQVTVEAEKGKVTLKGKAKNEAVRQEVETIAKDEPGVSSVDDQIAVDEYVTPAPPVVHQAAYEPPPPPPPQPMVVSAGTVLTVRTNQELSSKTSQVGTHFTASVSTPITVDGKTAIPVGSDVSGTVREAKKAGRFKGGALLTLTIDSVTVKGHQYNIETEAFNQASTGKGKRTAGMMAGGAGAGAAIGGLAGGGKGAAIGALVGVTAGTIGASTGNRDITLPVESALSFRLVQPLTLKP